MLKLFEMLEGFEGEAKPVKIVYISEVHCCLRCSTQQCNYLTYKGGCIIFMAEHNTRTRH